MNNRKNLIIISKMIRYCEDSIKYVKELNYDEFIKDEKTFVFSVFSLSQLGELANKIDDQFKDEYPGIPWNEIRGMRNRIVHDYEGIKYKIVWNILTKEISKLINNLEIIKDKLSGS